ncbi:C40 family peptidase [Flavobacterium sp. 123]|jgi:cell wall-associated NlpC family hydrolase|uniref:C40 family peptidase n=1 Tax=Flavobacterium sp. 123 TaxID=2135627 RepID=UPI000EAFD550|nr:C40 family peptidase [Flavobacterium sp. 123]
MRYLKLILVLMFLSSVSVFSQEKYTKHTITKGETISSIAEKYKVNPSVIYELNPDCRGVLKLKSVLLIPSLNSKKTNSVAEKVTNSSEKIHEVLPKETLFGIAKQYGITVEDLNKANPKLEASGLKKGQKITIPANGLLVSETVVVNPNKEVDLVKKKTIIHEVLPKQTKYSIAKQYGMTVADLEKANPKLEKKALQTGDKITVLVNEGYQPYPVLEKQEVEIVSKTVVPEKEIVKQDELVLAPTKEVLVDKAKQETEMIVYEVLQNETKYAIAKKYQITVSDIDKANPVLEKQSLRAGQKINVPVKEGFQPNVVVIDKEIVKTTTEPAISQKEIVKNEPEIVETTKQLEELNNNTKIIREVMPKETKFGIAKQYGITVQELEKQNPGIVKKLLVGYKLTIQSPNSVPESGVVEQPSDEKTKPAESNGFIRPSNNFELVDQLIQTASDNIGTRYRTGGTSKDGFDCSGLMCSTFGAFDIKLPRSSFEQANIGTRINTEEAQKGDLIFFKTNGRRQINHVGMVVEVCDGEIKFIHSSVSSGVIISSTKEKYYEKNFTQINRVLQ